MNRDEYINKLYEKLRNNFTVEKPAKIFNENFNLYAKCNLVLGRTFVTQKDIIDRYESNEYILLKHYKSVQEDTLVNIFNYINDLPNKLIKPHSQHKSSYINVVLLSDNSMEKSLEREIKTYKKSIIYKFYFQGFCEIRLLFVDLSCNKITTNKAGKDVKKVFSHF